jgi:hypothetical protein
LESLDLDRVTFDDGARFSQLETICGPQAGGQEKSAVETEFAVSGQPIRRRWPLQPAFEIVPARPPRGGIA